MIKKKILWIIFIGLIISCEPKNKENNQVEEFKTMSLLSNSFRYAKSMVEIKDGFIISGSTIIESINRGQTTLIRIDKTGNLIDSINLGINTAGLSNLILKNNDSFLLCGHDDENKHVLVKEFDMNFQIKSTIKPLGDIRINSLVDPKLAPLKDSGYFLVANSNRQSVLCYKFDNKFKKIWSKEIKNDSCSSTYSTSFNFEDFLIDSNGDIVIVGDGHQLSAHEETNHERGIFLVKLNSNNGDEIWRQHYGNGKEYYCSSSLVQLDDFYFTIGMNAEKLGSELDVFLLKTSLSGKIVSEKSFGGSDTEWGIDIAVLSSDKLVLTGYTHSSDGDFNHNKGNSDNYLMVVDSDLNLIDVESFGTNLYNSVVKVHLSSDGNLYLLERVEDESLDPTKQNWSNLIKVSR